jgi:hypothetical protein
MSTVEASVAGRATTPSGAAENAAEALRTLNHLTLAAPTPGAPGWEDVGDVYRVIGELRALADRLPQVATNSPRASSGSVIARLAHRRRHQRAPR